MNHSKIAVRYARALFDLASEKKQEEKVYESMQGIMAVLSHVPEVKKVLQSPVVEGARKKEIVTQIFTSADKLSLEFLYFLIRQKREASLEEIVRQFIFLYKQSKGILDAVVYTAIPLPEEMLNKIKNVLKQKYKEVDLTNSVNPSLIGGYVLQFNDVQFDASVVAKLKRIKTEFDNTVIK